MERAPLVIDVPAKELEATRDEYFNANQVPACRVRKKREWQQIPVLADRLRQKLSSRAPQSAQSGDRSATPANRALEVGQTLLANLPSAESVVRLVINLERVRAVAPGSPDDSLPVSPGDIIVVPLNADRMRPLATSTAVTAILFNLAVAVAAVGSL